MAKITNTVSTTSHTAQSVMARILATENIRVVVDPTMNTAAFDLKNRTLLLPQWKEMSKPVYDMLIGHEISHALHTPAEGWREVCNKISGTTDHNTPAWRTASLYLNIVEDARIERLIQIKFPGFRRDFIAAYNELNDKNFFGIKGQNMNSLTLADRINLYYKLGTIGSVGINFTAEEDAFIRRIDSATSFADAAQIAEDLFKHCNEKQHKNQPQQPQQGNSPSHGSQSDNGQNQSQSKTKQQSQPQSKQDNGDSDNTPDKGGNQGGNEKREGSGSDAQDGDGDQQQDQQKQPADKNDTPGAVGQNHSQGEVPPTPITQKSFNDNMQQQVARDQWATSVNAPTMLVRCNIDETVIDCKKIVEAARADFPFLWNPTKESERQIVAHATKEQAEFMRASKKQVDLLMKQFELRKAAQIAKRESVRKTGILDTVRMVNYKHSEDIFRRNTMLPEGKNHGLVMFVDWSGSMSVCLKAVMEQTMVLIEFCRRMQIPYEVFAFTTRSFNNGADSASYFPGNDDPNAPKARDSQWKSKTRSGYDRDSKEEVLTAGAYSPTTHERFSLLNLFSSRLTRTEHQEMLHFIRAFVSRSDERAQFSFYHPQGNSRWELSGTALDESIVAAMDIVPQFKESNKLDIVNTIFLTDGETSCPYLRGAQLIDPATKAVYSEDQFVTEEDRAYSVSGAHSTDVLLTALRDITKANVVGMYLTNHAGSVSIGRFFRNEVRRKTNMILASRNNPKDSWAQSAARRDAARDVQKDLTKKFSEDNCLIAEPGTSGYSEYYIIKSNTRVICDEDPMNSVQAGASQTALKKAFLKSFENKNKSRVLINRFMELIAR